MADVDVEAQLDRVVEFDLRFGKSLKKKLKVGKVDCFPLAYYEFQSNLNLKHNEWTFRIQ